MTSKKAVPSKPTEIYEWLVEQIREKEIRVGDQLPTEKSIMTRFGVNRTTVRTALSKFEKADMIMRRSGKGTFLIRDTPPQFVRTLNRLEVASQDSVTGTTTFHTFEKSWIDLPENIRMILNGKKSKHLHFKRVISVDGEPALLETTFLSEKLSNIFTDLDTNQPYYPLIEKYGGEHIASVKISFTSRKPTPEEAKLLKVDEHHACVTMQSQLFNDKNEVLEVLESLYRGDKYTFTMESAIEMPFSLNRVDSSNGSSYRTTTFR